MVVLIARPSLAREYIDPEVKRACKKYLASKGFNGFQVSLAIHPLTDFSVYAYTVPDDYSHTVFITSRMMDSIKRNLDNKLSLSVYDRFTLLHELGHLNPYGHEFQQEYAHHWEQITTLCKAGGIGIASLWILGLGLAFSSDKINSVISNQNLNRLGGLTFLSTFLSTFGVSAHIYATKIIQINGKFKKYTFSHSDKKYEEHVKKACEETDADLFALKLLNRQELNELYSHFSSQTDQFMKDEDNQYHPTPYEQCTAIEVELATRNS